MQSDTTALTHVQPINNYILFGSTVLLNWTAFYWEVFLTFLSHYGYYDGKQEPL